MEIRTVILLLVLSVVRAQGEVQCEEEAGGVQFTVTSRRNVTGHRTITADLMSRFSGNRGDNGTGLDVQHTWGRCGGLQYLRVATTASTATGLTPRPVPAGYDHFPGVGYYKLYTALQPWAEAQQTCQGEGANLIVINSEAEAEVVRKIYTRKIPLLTGRGCWAGFHAQFKPGHFLTVFGETLTKAGYEKWSSGQPAAGKFCGFTFKHGLLNTWQCEEPSPFICELQL